MPPAKTLTVLAFFSLSIVLVAATSTRPISPDVSALPVFYLVNSSKTGELIVTQTPSAADAVLSEGRYNSSNSAFGWDFCQVKANDTTDGFYAAGYLEGYLGYTSMSFYNWSIAVAPTAASDDWVEAHISFMRDNIRQYEQTNAFWAQIGKLFAQMEGIA